MLLFGFCALKPHLFLPFGLVLLVWVVVSSRYRVVLGAVVAFAVTTGVAVVIDPSVWAHYVRMMLAARIDTQVIPCVSVMLRLIISPNNIWIQSLPAVMGCVWALVWFRLHRNNWD